MERTLKQQILQAAEAVKRKVKKMRNFEIDNRKVLESVFEPITSPLNEILDKNKKSNTSIKNEIVPKKEFDDSVCVDQYENESDVNSSTLSVQNKTDPKNVFNHTMCADNYESESEKDKDENSYEEDMDESFASTSSNSNKNLPSWLSSEIIDDIPFGIRRHGTKLYMGRSPISINSDRIIVDSKKYITTPGLTELLLKKDPDLSILTNDDIKNYKLMLQDTNAHRRDFDGNKPIKSNKGKKYLQIIRPLFQKLVTEEGEMTQGSGLPNLKQVNNSTDYIYWDDPNELVERLKLLIASRDAGNTGHNNEIISIIEELRESGIIN